MSSRSSLPIVVLLAWACGGGNTGANPPAAPPATTPASITILQAPTAPVEVGAVVQLQAEVRSGTGTVLTNQPLAWSSSNVAVATVTRSGRVSTVSAGTARIIVSVGTVSNAIDLAVADPAIVSVSVFPATMGLAPGESGQFSASALGPNGTVPGVPISWTTSNPGVASIDATGKVTAIAPGKIVVRARAGLVFRERGLTVSNDPGNVKVARADFIQVAQNAAADVPLIRGKRAAVRLFPQASVAGFLAVPIRVRVQKAGATVFEATVSSGSIPTVVDLGSPTQGIFVPLPTSLDLEGATLRATIDPDGDFGERDEWDNDYPALGDDPPTIHMQTAGTLRVRLVSIAPQGEAPPALDPATVESMGAFMRTVYPTPSVELTTRSASMVSPFPWVDKDDLSDALADLEVERVADGWNGSYYGVFSYSGIAGIAGLGYVGGRSALGSRDGVVFAHEIGHNLGLNHAPGCGAAGANAGYPYPNGEIGIRGFDPVSGGAIPATAIDMMGYCGGPKWISGGYYKGILAALPQPGSLTTLRTVPGDMLPVAVTARIGATTVALRPARRLPHAKAFSPDEGAVLVELLDADGGVLVTQHLAVQSLDPGDAAGRFVAGIVPLPRALAPRLQAVRVSAGGQVAVADVTP